jgi:hypothetical protein
MLLAGQRSPRNPLVVDVLRDYGLVGPVTLR